MDAQDVVVDRYIRGVTARRAPSERLRADIDRWIDEDAQAEEPGAWPRRQFAGRRLLLLHGNQAFFWYLDRDGRVFCVDHDTFAMMPEPEHDETKIREALEAGARAHPALAELLGR